MSPSGRIRITAENLDTGFRVVRELGPDEYVVIVGPELESIETPLLLRRGARVLIRERYRR